FFLTLTWPLMSSPFPYTTLFRSSSSSFGGHDYYTGRQIVADDELNRIWMNGITVSLGKRLQWPDNYFQLNYSLGAQQYKLQNYPDRKSTRLNSSHVKISYAVYSL